ncbi:MULTISPECIES: hypothetical protein [Bacillus cereus group]|uniref:Uncharacterized protein n=1 Tax=Bacillus thuringiensis serovar toumanoffi TaxID=180862 RepID=A0ABD5IAC3_BACTU|nr:hypothetical protein [Bacillus thuringiensis]AMR88264.1 hypothetical protein A3L20_30075 [Bacillus thuringiensis]EEM92364.1 hypothetical protein bthur0013_62830 [Bacillus thuringiensis IBL 200]MBG9636027.1 hypothetical protein [Bacillus thuringiensis]MBG9675928.1 hypothetical protein [Bacillus thuringiensis]MCR6784360.1 hypothetical protein [Bacillus thuringiensis]
MERLDGIYRDRMLMVALLMFSSITFLIMDVGLEYLKEFSPFVIFVRFAIVIAPVIMILSTGGIIAASILIEQAKKEIKKDMTEGKM